MCKIKTQMSHFLFGVSAKHFKDEVSTTVSQNATTGSATLISAKQKQTLEVMDGGLNNQITLINVFRI